MNDDNRKILRDMRDSFLPQMRSSVYVIGVVMHETDPFLLMQIGAAVILDKPLLLIAYKGAWIPAKARQIAYAVVEMNGPEDHAKVQQAVAALAEKIRKEQQKI